MGNSFKVFKKSFFVVPSKEKVVVITGCDSGLGYSLSHKCNQMGLSVVCGCLDVRSEGARALASDCYVYSLDVTDSNSVREFLEKVRSLTEESNYELHAVVNNAGVMIFGEFEWYTERQVDQQVRVNMLGSFKMAKAFLPLLRQHKGRLINISSHCALFNLPTLTVYGATKAALESWTNGLRMEQKKYQVKVISFIPGSFATESNIMAKQDSYSSEMENSFSADDKKFYGEYFKEFASFLGHVSREKKPVKPLEDEQLYEKFTQALLKKSPKSHYKHQPLSYFFYYNAFKVTPLWFHDYLVQKFMKFPRFKQVND